jgi:hypothetical protein
MEKSELNGEKFARRAARTRRLRRQRRIGSSFKSLKLLTLHYALAAFGRSITASACSAVHSARNVILMMLMRQQELAF